VKVLGFIGSPRKNGNTEVMVKAALKGAKNSGADISVMNIPESNIGGCKACMYCRTNNGCGIEDDMQKVYKEIESADAIVLGFPVYMLSINAQTKIFVDRLFPYLNMDFTTKVNKKTLIVVTQGAADKNAFIKNLGATKEALTMLGFPVDKIIIEGNGNIPGIHAKNEDLIKELEKAGSELVSA
jgi:multimeric flavodoxin WrbA